MHDLRNEELRRAAVESLSREELGAVMAALPDDELIGLAKVAIAALGAYRARLTKEERLRGSLEEAQTIEITVQESPLALRAEFVGGPSKGRRVLYNSALRAEEMRVREKGILGVVPLWVGVNSSLAKMSSNHGISDLSYAAVVALLERDFSLGKAAGGHRRENTGFEGDGIWATDYVAPESCPGLYATRARLTMDLRLGLPVSITIYDAQGLLERFRFELLERRLRLGPEFFTLKGAGL